MVCAPVLLGPRAYEERSRSSGTHLRLGFLRISLSVLLHAEAGALGGAFAVRSGAAAGSDGNGIRGTFTRMVIHAVFSGTGHLKRFVGRVVTPGVHGAACRFVFKRGAAGLLTIAGHGAFYLDFRFAASAGAVVDAAFHCTF